MDYLLIGSGILFILNIVVSIYLYKRNDLESFQKKVQIVVVWLIPFVGAIALWLFNRSQDDDNKPAGGAFDGGSSNSGMVNSGD